MLFILKWTIVLCYGKMHNPMLIHTHTLYINTSTHYYGI